MAAYRLVQKVGSGVEKNDKHTNHTHPLAFSGAAAALEVLLLASSLGNSNIW